MRLLLVRHGESTANRDRLVLGRSLHVPLTERGREQAVAACDRVAQLVDGPAVIFCSDALRTRQTAGIISERLAVAAQPQELLREQDLGDLEGRPVGELGPLPVPDGLDITEVAWGGGESIAQVHARMAALLDWLARRDDPSATVVLVGHGHAHCVLQAVLAGRSHREVDWAESLDLGAVREVLWIDDVAWVDQGQIW